MMKIQSMFCRPLRLYPLMAMYLLLIGLPVAVAPYTGGFISVKGFAAGMVQAFAPAWLITAVVNAGLGSARRWMRVCARVLAILAAVMLAAGCYAEFFIGYNVMCRLNHAVIQLVLQSDSAESAEFLEYAAGLPGTYTALAWTLLPAAVGAVLEIARRRLGSPGPRGWLGAVTGAALAVSVAGIVVCHRTLFTPPVNNQSFMLTAGQIVNSVHQTAQDQDELKDIAAANRAVAIDSCRPDTAMIVLVIGESFNRSHSSLYGYRLPTNRRLEAIAADTAGGARLLVFGDAVSGDRTTSLVMKRLLSTNAPAAEWRHRPLLPAVLRKGGYRVMYFDNQSTPVTCNGIDYGSVYFLNNPLPGGQSLDRRNDARMEYDGDFVACYLPEVLAAGGRTVTFFHLMGQHVLGSERYPDGTGVFSAADYRGSLPSYCDSRAIDDIMHYDNATAYNDSVVGGIIDAVSGRDAIVVYLSDHGEEVYDRRARYGRSREPVDANLARALFEVPLVVYMSGTYRRNHPEIAAALQSATGKRVSTYDFPDLVLDIAGISTSVASRARSIASPSYDDSRPRLIEKGSIDYDSIMAAGS